MDNQNDFNPIPDGRMQCFVGNETWKSFLENSVPKIWFKPNVSPEIVRSFNVVQKLMEFGYCEYEFCDIAAVKSLLNLEMALKIRYFELTGEQWNQKSTKPPRNLSNLMKWFGERQYFEIENEDYLKHVRWMRNYWAHPERYGFGGLLFLKWVYNSIDLINDIYEDVSLRINRFELRNSISQNLQQVISNGGYFTSKNLAEVIYDARILFIDNKESPAIYYIALFPTDIDYGDNSIRKKFILLKTEALNFNENCTELVAINKDAATTSRLTSTLNSEQKLKYDNFIKDRKIFTSPGFSLEGYHQSNVVHASDFFGKTRRAFHRK